MARAGRQQYHLRMRSLACFVPLMFFLVVPARSETILPAYVLELPEHVQTVLIAETETSTLHRFTRTSSGFEARESVYMSVGENGVGKERAWDRRTPLGVYFINDRLDTSRMHERYGPLALPLDYPNAWDQRSGRTGDGIWIHGVSPDGGLRPPLDTDGCLALPNEELLRLEPHVQQLITPVVITRTIKAVSAAENGKLRAELKAVLKRWAGSFRAGDWHSYLALYSADFEFHGLDKERWSAYRIRSAAARPAVDFRIDQVMLLADPEAENLYLSRFRQEIVSDRGRVLTTKRLYWRREADGELRIIVEDNG